MLLPISHDLFEPYILTEENTYGEYGDHPLK